jgi:hypothetical protein
MHSCVLAYAHIRIIFITYIHISTYMYHIFGIVGCATHTFLNDLTATATYRNRVYRNRVTATVYTKTGILQPCSPNRVTATVYTKTGILQPCSPNRVTATVYTKTGILKPCIYHNRVTATAPESTKL